MEDNTLVVTKDEIVKQTSKDPTHAVLEEYVFSAKLSDKLKDTIYGKVFKVMSLVDDLILKAG